MKKRIMGLLMTTVVCIAPVFAQSCDILLEVLRNELAGGIEKITVNARINVVLLQNRVMTEPIVEGDEEMMKDIVIRRIGNEVIISATRHISYQGKVLVTVPVQELRRLEVNNRAEVASINVLETPGISVLIGADCKVKLKATGKIFFEGSDYYNYRYVFNSDDIKKNRYERESIFHLE